jgi:hypothetical protein
MVMHKEDFMSLLKKLSLLAIATGFLSSANAGVLLEPYVGYQTGKTKNSGVSTDFSGLDYGARVGWQQMGFMLGLDFMTGKMTDKAKTPKSNDVTPQSFGVFVGYNFPVLLRVYGTYGFSNSVKLEQTGQSNKIEGSPLLKLGVGYNFLPLLSIALEYTTATYDEYNGTKMTNDTTSSAYGVSISVPFTL